MSLEIEIARAKEAGDKKVAKFSGAVRSLENPALEIGDTWTFPEKYDVYEQKLNGNSVQYIFIETDKGNVKKFYPTTFTKSRAIYNEDGELTGERVHTMGTAADLYRSAASIQDGMNKLAGKTVKVTDLITIRTLRYGSKDVVDSFIPTIDLVDKK